MGGVIACHAHGRDGEVGEMDGAGLGAWRRVRSPSWGTSLVLGLPVFWSPAVGAWCARRLRWPGSYLGGWAPKWGRIRLGGTPLRDVSRLWGTATVGGGTYSARASPLVRCLAHLGSHFACVAPARPRAPGRRWLRDPDAEPGAHGADGARRGMSGRTAKLWGVPPTYVRTSVLK